MSTTTRTSLLTDEDRAALYADIDALPPLTEAQLDAVVVVLDEIDRKRQRPNDAALGPSARLHVQDHDNDQTQRYADARI